MLRSDLDVLAIGDAIVDVIATADDAFLVREKLVKGSMRLIDAAEASRLYAMMGSASETSGGSAANSMAGLAAMGGRAGFVGLVAKDQLGEIFAHDIRALGVAFDTPPDTSGEPTGRCLILVTPDGQRTMNTCPGASHLLGPSALDRAAIEGAAILYLEAYLWVPEAPRGAMEQAIAIARNAGRRVALTLSDIACIRACRNLFLGLIDGGKLDLLFANEAELRALAGTDDVEDAARSMATRVPMLVVTMSEKGAAAFTGGERVRVPAAHVDAVIDTTGAGDQFAAGFLAAQARGRSVADSLGIGAAAAAEVISHFGARPLADLKPLLAA